MDILAYWEQLHSIIEIHVFRIVVIDVLQLCFGEGISLGQVISQVLIAVLGSSKGSAPTMDFANLRVSCTAG